MNFEIQLCDDSSEEVLLLFWSTDGSIYGDTWHRSQQEAEAVASEEYGLTSDQWERF